MHFEAAIDGAHIEANRAYTDKGSASHANRQFLKQRKINSAIMPRIQEQTASARQLLRNDKSQCPSRDEKHLHEPKENCQQNFRRRVIKENNLPK